MIIQNSNPEGSIYCYGFVIIVNPALCLVHYKFHNLQQDEKKTWDRDEHMGGSINGGSPIAGWSRRENPTNIDDLGVPLFQESLIC